LPANRNFPRFSTKNVQKNAAQPIILALFWTPSTLQVVVMQYIMHNLAILKKNAKKLKKTLYIYREKGDDLPRCSRKHSRKKVKKNH